MTPAELAIAASLPFEAKKDSMRQTQAGTWKVTFTVQATDVPRSLTEAMPGTRYQVVIVEIDGNELQVQPAKEVVPDTVPKHESIDARPGQDGSPVRAKRDWRDLPPAQQAGIRCEEGSFTEFLRFERPDDWNEEPDAVRCVRLICGVESRADLNTNQKARVIWHQLNDQYEAWMRVGA